MEEAIRIEAKTLEAAIEEAADKLSCSKDDLDIEIIEKGASGFLGLRSKPFIIEAKIKAAETASEAEEVKTDVKAESNEEAKEETITDKSELAKAAKSFLADVFAKMDINVDIESKYNAEDDCIEVNMSGDDMGNLIGKRGQTLDSLQYLTSLVVNKKTSEYTRVKLDTENYRERRKETLENLATNIAFKVKRTKRSVKLEPMNPYERRIIHSALQNDKYVTTKSEGEEPYRHVVVSLKRERRY